MRRAHAVSAVVHPQPDGEIDVDALGGLAEEFEAWRFDRLQTVGSDSYEVRMNWKLGIDTFGETYHFSTLHKNTLAPNFYGNVQPYDTFGRNHRMGLCYRSIDELRAEPRKKWHISTFPSRPVGGFSIGGLRRPKRASGTDPVSAGPDPPGQ